MAWLHIIGNIYHCVTSHLLLFFSSFIPTIFSLKLLQLFFCKHVLPQNKTHWRNFPETLDCFHTNGCTTIRPLYANTSPVHPQLTGRTLVPSRRRNHQSAPLSFEGTYHSGGPFMFLLNQTGTQTAHFRPHHSCPELLSRAPGNRSVKCGENRSSCGRHVSTGQRQQLQWKGQARPFLGRLWKVKQHEGSWWAPCSQKTSYFTSDPEFSFALYEFVDFAHQNLPLILPFLLSLRAWIHEPCATKTH